MGLTGTYKNEGADAVLTITSANDSNGELKGSLQTTYNGQSVTLTVTGHYHFLNSTGSATSIAFMGMHDDNPASIYEGWAGTSTGPSYQKLVVEGARSTLASGKEPQLRILPGDFQRVS